MCPSWWSRRAQRVEPRSGCAADLANTASCLLTQATNVELDSPDPECLSLLVGAVLTDTVECAPP